MIRRLALTAGFALLGAVAFAPNAHAQVADTEPVPFTGTVGSVCTLSNPQPGTLGLVDVNTLDSNVPDSDPSGGMSGSITVNCNSNSIISAVVDENPEVPEDFDVTTSTLAATLSSANAGFTSNTPSEASLTSSNTDVPVDVDLRVESTTPLPEGRYEYNVTVTASPN
ncbi:hypothetical protein [Calothrix sp. CCY 0018]|uniref:hypothetical protein n=1 Tax=Calothrix sp. CCY 0018 TaxID=3103864 RepID=UPI0039C703DA